MIQLDLFLEAEPDPIVKELGYVKQMAKETRESSDKVRKCIFARYGELAHKYMELHNRMDIIERNICNGKL
jgi:hypothetical protein